jgi:peptidyl-prolyl cis-trans isomerase SurA
MSTPLRRRAALFTAALMVPMLGAPFANAQLQAPRTPSRVNTPNVSLPADIAGVSASPVLRAPVQQAPVAAAGPVDQVNEGVAALVNDDIITTYDLRQRMRLLVLTSGVQPTSQTLPQLEQEALRSLVDEHLQIQELKKVSKKQKIDLIANDKDVDDEIGDLAKQNNISAGQMKTSFAAQGVNIDTLRDQIRTQLSWQRLISGMYGSRVRIGDAQVTGALQRISDQASQTQYLVGEIFIDSARVGGMNEALAGANQLVTQLQQGAPFSGVARQFSAAPTAANGGDAGWISAAQAQPEVAKALEGLRPGQLSTPITVADGVYIVYLRDKQAASGQTMVSLKQLAVRLDKDANPDQVTKAETALNGLRPQITGCDVVEKVAGKAPGVVAADLGEAEINDLRGPFKDAAVALKAGEVSQPIRTDVGVHLVAVCSKRAGGAKMPTRSDISNRLYAEQLSVMSRRYLRDLRNSATIESR